ncbi:ribonuclease H-like domain-containing protein [Tanacetum coccineum]|uniref:Ribonuclease H-like domain-containing protein n=1 Tax=Tanacetum coccineum TaxID=301880 RepID=A0ABQ5AYP7_9ASTR
MVDPGKKLDGDKNGDDSGGSSSNIVIDINDPLYLHSSDTNGTPLIGLKLTGTENYRVWVAALKHCINSKNKLGFITAETYDKIDGSGIFNLHYKINTISQNGSKLSDYYHKLNSLWREYDVMVPPPVCTCEGASSYKDHAQLLKLIQFVMGLNDVHAPITLLTTEPLPTIKGDFSLLSRDKSHRNMHSGSYRVKESSSAFVSRYDNKGSLTSFVSRPVDNKKRFNKNNNIVRNPNLVCKNCNMTENTIERCFEIIGYPLNFKKKNNSGKNVSNVCVSSKTVDTSVGVSHTLTSDQYQRLISLLSDSGASQHMTFTTTFLFNIIDVSHLDIIMAHPNGTKAKVNQIGSCKVNDNLVIHDVLDSVNKSHMGARSEKDGLYFLNLGGGIPLSMWSGCVLTDVYLINRLPTAVLSGKSPYELVFNYKPKLSHLRSNDPSDDVRVNSEGGGTNPSFVESVVAYADADLSLTAEPSASTSNEIFDNSGSKNSYDVNSKMLGNITAQGQQMMVVQHQIIFIYDGEDLDFNMLLQSNEGVTEHSNIGGPRKSSKKSVLPNKLNDYVLNSKVRYGLDKVVSYSNFSSDNFSFVTNLNKTTEPKSYKEAAIDPRCLLSLVVQQDWIVYQLNINNAFLYGELVEDVYMTLLEGYFIKDDNKDFGFEQSKNDFSLYVKSAGESFMVLLVYVDDILITGYNISESNNCKHLLNFKFMIKDLGLTSLMLSQVMHSLKQSDPRLAFKVLRYLKGSPGKGVLYSKRNMFNVYAYVDSGPSALQPEGLSLDMQYKIANGVIMTCKVKLEENVTDILTKGLSIDEHKKFCGMLNLFDSFQV